MREKVYSKKFRKLLKDNKQNILSKAKFASKCPWDWEAGIELFIAHLKFMRDFYKNNEYVYAQEDCEWNSEVKLTRLEMIDEILKEYIEWRTCDDKYFKYCEKLQESGDTVIKSNTHRALTDAGCVFEYSLTDPDLTVQAYNEEYEFHKKHFFELLAQYIEYLWD